MEARKEALRALAVCRFCLRRGASLSSIYDKSRRKAPVSLPLQIMACVNIEVFPSDGMPSQICERCVFFMEQCYQFKQVCRSADETLLQFVQTGEDPEAVPWPQELLETAAVRSAVEGVKRGRAAAAAAQETQVKVRVSTGSEVDSDDDDVLNIKIETEHGEETGVPARIKVTQRDGKLLITEEGEETREQDAMDDEEIEMVGKNASKPEEGKFPCGECDRTFPLRQQLQLHMKRQHRERTVQCPQCPDKFFSKYDLVTHLSRHSDEMPFECVACSRQFKRHNLLKRHEKVAHADSSRYACKECTMMFLSLEELHAHSSRHQQYESRPYKCPAKAAEGEDQPCDRRFQTKSSMMRHLDHVHNTSDLRHTCNYCPQKFSTAQRLARHIKEHAGQRPYPCKYCSKTFLKSHHYTRHVRAKHSRSSLARQEMSATEVYNCSECRETFTTQEELAYHEAEHATRSLTCPLCMAHFADVDAVTDHIKLHADQEMQFLCDYCDLVFVSEEALETHASERHVDEIKLSQLMNNSAEAEVENDEENSPKEELLTLSVEGGAELKPTVAQETSTLASEELLGTDNEMVTYTELSTVDTLHMARLQSIAPAPPRTPPSTLANDQEAGSSLKTAGILRKAEEVKRRAEQERAQHRSPAKKQVRPAHSPVQSPAPVRKPPAPDKKPAPSPARPAQASTPVDKERRTAEKPPVTEKAEKPTLTEKLDKPTLTEKANGVEKQKEREKEKERHKEPSDREKDRTASDKDRERTKESSDRDRERAERSEKDKSRQRKQEEQSNRGKERAKQTNDKEKERSKEKEKENEESKAETPSDKSLRLLERDLLELKRTSSAGRSSEMSEKPSLPRRGRPPTMTPPTKLKVDTPKTSGVKLAAQTPQNAVRRRVAPYPRDRDNRERERREERERDRDKRDEREKDAASISKDTSKDTREKDANQESSTEAPRRSSRTARIKDYAKMIRDSRDSASSDFEESDASEDESPPAPTPVQDGKRRRGRPRREPVFTPPTPTSSASASTAPEAALATPAPPATSASATPTARRRGRPSVNVKLTSIESKRRKSKSQEEQSPVAPSAAAELDTASADTESASSTPLPPSPTPTSAPIPATTQVQSPTQQGLTTSRTTLTPVPASVIKSLPPGVRPLPLPAQLKTVSGSICEMMMGERVVKVQKIIMTKAEVEAMSKKGLLEMKHGTMVLKQGFKLPPSSDPAAIRSTLARAASAPSPASTPAPTLDSVSAEPSEPMEGATSGPVSSDTPQPMEI